MLRVNIFREIIQVLCSLRSTCLNTQPHTGIYSGALKESFGFTQSQVCSAYIYAITTGPLRQVRILTVVELAATKLARDCRFLLAFGAGFVLDVLPVGASTARFKKF